MSRSKTIHSSATKVVSAIRRRWIDERIPGREIGKTLGIYDIICPLRYDVVVRANFIEMLAANEDLLAAEFEALLEYPATQAYEVWFREVCVRRFFPGIYGDEIKVRQAFRERVEQTRHLWTSVSANGIDPSQPISLSSGKRIGIVNGKLIGATIFAGDGCHRMACMLVLGKDALQPHEYEVVRSTNHTPLDNTAILIDALPLTQPDYLAFIAKSYCTGENLATADEILDYVKANGPARLAELESVFEYDLPRLA